MLAHSPSSQDGVPAAAEARHRAFGCGLAADAGAALSLPHVCVVTAQTLLQRFFYRASLRRFDAFQVAMAAVFLAAKIEESPRRLRDVLNVFHHLLLRRTGRAPRRKRTRRRTRKATRRTAATGA